MPTESQLCLRLSQGVAENEPTPPLCAALSAFLRRGSWKVQIVDPRGRKKHWAGPGPLWVHLETGIPQGRVDEAIAAWENQPDFPLRFFGPGLADPEGVADLRRNYGQDSCVVGDPEAAFGPLDRLDDLPIATYEGFGPGPPGLFRVLAGRGRRNRSVGHFLREVIYLVETFQAGHLIFDDADLSAYGTWIEEFQSEAVHLPWSLTWEGQYKGQRLAGCNRNQEPTHRG